MVRGYKNVLLNGGPFVDGKSNYVEINVNSRLSRLCVIKILFELGPQFVQGFTIPYSPRAESTGRLCDIECRTFEAGEYRGVSTTRGLFYSHMR